MQILKFLTLQMNIKKQYAPEHTHMLTINGPFGQAFWDIKKAFLKIKTLSPHNFLQTLILNSKHIFPTDPKYKMHHKNI